MCSFTICCKLICFEIKEICSCGQFIENYCSSFSQNVFSAQNVKVEIYVVLAEIFSSRLSEFLNQFKTYKYKKFSQASLQQTFQIISFSMSDRVVLIAYYRNVQFWNTFPSSQFYSITKFFSVTDYSEYISAQRTRIKTNRAWQK